jgi:peptide methionine sulfoxide reductase MsrB
MGDRPMSNTNMTRRTLLRAFAATTVAAAPVMANATGFLRGAGDIRRLRMYNGRAGESLDMIYWIEGEYIRPALEEINYFFRDWRDNTVHRIDQRTIDILTASHRLMETDEPFTLLSGYRSPVHQRDAAQPVLRRCAQLPPPARRGGGCAAAVTLGRPDVSGRARLQRGRRRSLLALQFHPRRLRTGTLLGWLTPHTRGAVPLHLAPRFRPGRFLLHDLLAGAPRWTSPVRSPYWLDGQEACRMTTYTKDPDAIAKLTPEQFRVTQQDATERPGTGEYLAQQGAGDLRRRGLGRAAVRLVGQVRKRLRLAQLHQADRTAHVIEKRDLSLGMIRTEVRSPMATAIWAMSFPTARATGAVCVTASTRPRCASSIATTWRPKVTATTSIRWRIWHEHDT